MNFRAQTLDELSKRSASITQKQALLGFDGFVDRIMQPVAQRHGQGDAFTPIAKLADFGQRIVDAAGESLNIELFLEREKLGGNGPIMANALQAAGPQVKYIGALGQPQVHPVFADFAQRTDAVSLTDPGVTHALEFADGKLMLGTMTSLDAITYARMLEVMGEGAFLDALSRADLIGLVNWTMIPNMTSLFSKLLDFALPNLGPREDGRAFFFDLADPAKRSDADLQGVLQTISRFRTHGRVILGLNLAEARQVCRVLDLGDVENVPEMLQRAANRLRNHLEVYAVVVHPRQGAAAATQDDTWYVEGPFVEKPKISTGAGDHFNAGFSAGVLMGLSIPACLTVAVATSGQYVRTAQSPSLSDTQGFLRNWA